MSNSASSQATAGRGRTVTLIVVMAAVSVILYFAAGFYWSTAKVPETATPEIATPESATPESAPANPQ